jgi:5-(aminomethyl)-3-furanmethanol phosphate kinase
LGITTVAKIGGGMLARVEDLDAVLAEIAIAGRHCPLLVVPGGGPFADHVRDVDRRLGLTDDAAHWMAILAMEQYAHLIVSRLPDLVLVCGPREIQQAVIDGRISVLAPYQWMREADPLPHSWDVTSDSISAWVAGQVGATRLVLVKPPGASGPDIADRSFERFLPPQVGAEIVAADQIEQLRAILGRKSGGSAEAMRV